MNYKEICEQTIGLVKNTATLIREEKKNFSTNQIVIKGNNDFVTHIDKASEEHLVKGLSKILPGSGFITEEGTASYENCDHIWIIDPIDGTTNFIHGAPPYCISIALHRNDEPVIGVVYELTGDECFYAYQGGKAYLNGKEIHVSPTLKVKDSLIATGFPYTDFGRMASFMKTLDYFFHNSHGVRRLGSAAADLAYVACGRYDSFYEYNLSPWDVAAGAYIVQQAGGKVSDFKGGKNFIFGKELIATNQHTFEEFKSVIGNIMNK